MKLDAMIRMLMPREERFHELFARDTENLLRAVRVFGEIARHSGLDARRVKFVELKALEHDGDGITRQIFEALNSTFITPMDREDIRSLAKDLDDVLDFLEGVGQALILFELEEAPDGIQQFAAILERMAVAIDRVMRLVWDLNNEKEIQECVVAISDLENQADHLYNALIADLFKDGNDPMNTLKWKEIYDGLEDACDECKELTHVVANIMVKNA